MYHLRRFYYDTAAANDSLHMGILKLAIPISQVLFGSDYPWGSAAATAAGLQRSGLTAAELRAIYRENALRIFPKL
jgi:predicted TIM-barrel fold metal-dependent hydrolase